MKHKIVIAAFTLILIQAASAFGEPANRDLASGETIHIKAGARLMTAVMNDTITTKEFLAMLPITLSTERLFDREYYTSLPKKISVAGEPVKEFRIGDIAYWPYWNYFGILFSQTRPLSSPIVVMGHVVSGLESLEVAGQTLEITFQTEPFEPVATKGEKE